MRRGLFVFLLIALAFTACAPQAAATEEPAVPEPDEPSTPTHVPVDLTPAQLAAIKALSENLGLPASDIKLVSTEAVDWPDGCLGVQEEGLMCTQVIMSGFRVILEANGREVEYRTNEDGTQIRPATILLTWKREGGIAGFCDYLTVYLSGEVHRSSCKDGKYVEGLLIDVLSKAEMTNLNEWVETYGNVTIDASDPKGVSDRMVVILELMGQGNQKTVSEANEKELLEFAQSLSQALSKR
jgi:hypothetical protein